MEWICDLEDDLWYIVYWSNYMQYIWSHDLSLFTIRNSRYCEKNVYATNHLYKVNTTESDAILLKQILRLSMVIFWYKSSKYTLKHFIIFKCQSKFIKVHLFAGTTIPASTFPQ